MTVVAFQSSLSGATLGQVEKSINSLYLVQICAKKKIIVFD
jgi:hypothetical protein